MTMYAQRRQKLLAQLPTNAILLLPAAPVAYRSHDVAYPYRPDNDLYYLTGFPEPDAVALWHCLDGQWVFWIFCKPRDPVREQWEGLRWGPAEAKERLGADSAFPLERFGLELEKLLAKNPKLYYPAKRAALLRTLYSALPVGEDSSPAIAELRVLKTAVEIAHIQEAVDITVEAHLRAMQQVRPLQYEYMMEAVLLEAFCRRGCRYPAYPSIVAGGANACILHYHDNNQQLKAKDLLLIDAGAEVHHYAADITRTFPVSGHFLPQQRALYDVVLAAQLAGIAAIGPGKPYAGIQSAIVEVLVNGLLDLGIFQGKAEDIIHEKLYRSVYMHGSGHWLGMDVHDAGTYQAADGSSRLLEAGMVLTVEPGIYINAHYPTIDPQWHGIGIRIEDDILVTAKGAQVLSQALPKKSEDIEALMRENANV